MNERYIQKQYKTLSTNILDFTVAAPLQFLDLGFPVIGSEIFLKTWISIDTYIMFIEVPYIVRFDRLASTITPFSMLPAFRHRYTKIKASEDI